MKSYIYQRIFALLLSFCLGAGVQSSAQTNLVPDDQEFQALKALYDSLDGPNWTNKTNWPTSGNWPATATAAEMDTWFGITVVNGDISAILLQANNLTGRLPQAVSLLSQLIQLQLYSNKLNGPVPSSLGSLNKLTWLRLDANQLTGTIPSSLGNLPLLRHLYLNTNSFSGTIPSSLGSLGNLQILALAGNQLTGSIPQSLGGLGNLTYLTLFSNQLTGAIPASLGNLNNLTSLQLQGNQLSGNIPPELGNLTKLITLYLNNNQLSGHIPPELGNLSNLTLMYLYGNALSGVIPASFGNLSNVTYLRLHDNQLTGSIPSELGNLVKLQHLRLYGNQLTGVIPSSFSNLTSLITMNLSANKLLGAVPDIFGGMTSLTDLNLASNNFTGAFPGSIGSCSSLAFLYINLNQFTSLPSSLLSLPVLNYLNIESNEINALPDLSTHVNKANLSLWMRQNRLDFSQLESLVTAGFTLLYYSPQKPINDITAVTLTEGSPLMIAARPTGQFSTVTWEKQNANGTWTTLTNDQDSNPQTYTRTTATPSDEGIYRWKMTNTQAAGLTLLSDLITVKTATRFVLDDLAFQYKYDARKRMTHKKVPGADWVYMVYDDRDRLVMTQDGEQRKANKWSFTKYDALNRPVMTGIYTHSAFADQTGMSGLISAANFFETYNGDATNHGYSKVVFPTTGTEVLTVTYYDNYNFVTEDAYQFDDDALEGQYLYAAGSAFPRVTGQVTGTKTRMLSGNAWARTVNYYDDQYRVVQIVTGNNQGGVDRTTNRYDFVGKVLETSTVHVVSGLRWKNAVNIEVAGNTLIKTGAGSWGNAGAVSAQILPAGTDGWMEVVVPENGYWTQHIGLSSADPNPSYTNIEYGFRVQGFYYAYVYENGVQPSQSPASISVVPGDVLRVGRTGNTVKYYKNGVLLYTSAVPSTSQLIVDCALKETGTGLQDVRTSFIPSSQSVIRRTFNYDHAGRLLKTWHSVNGAPLVLLAQNEYNALGQLVTKNLYNTDPASAPDASRAFRQQLDYRYNIRGWLTRVNNSDVSITENGPRDYFGMNLFYNETVPELSGSQPQFNGNISAMKWSTNLGLGGSVPALEVDGPKENAYAFRYDTLNRLKSAAFHTKPSTGWGASTAYHEDNLKYDHNGNIKSLNRTTTEGASMDQLTYAYSGNQLLKVSDASDKTKGFVDGPSPDNDYTYDANGNMTLDRNKEITAITYNHLNLPDKVTKSTGEYVKYTYDATGRKLSQGVYNAGNVLQKKSDYAGEFFYENDTLKFVNHEEGRVVMTDPAPGYQYHLKDHLGNVRMTFTTKEEIEDVKATMETASVTTEHSQFLNYDEAVKVNSTLFDHTANGTTHYATRLRGSTNEQYGLAKSLSVMPGDTIRIEVFAKYIDPNSANWQQVLSDLMTSIANGTAPAGTVVDGGVAGSIGNTAFPYGGLLEKTPGGTPPKAFVNYIMFDRDVNPIFDPEQTNFIQVSELARETGTNGDHERLYAEVIAKQAGLMYIYLSNDNVELGGSAVEVFFDDFRVEHVKSPVVQMDDYYPFGLTFNSYSRENSLAQNFKYNGVENENELDLNGNITFFRMHDPTVGRWWQIDPKPREDVTPYAAMGNNPILYSDPMGDTTRVYSMQGKLLYSIDVKEKQNQAHFVSGKFEERSQGKNESDAEYSARVRAGSIAFIGSNTIKDLQEIVGQSNKLKLEVAFVGSISESREIQLSMMPVDENNHFDYVGIDSQLDKNYPDSQPGLFLFGHVHHKYLSNDPNSSEGFKEKDLGTPSWSNTPTGRRPVDYYKRLRNADDTRRISPAMIGTPYGYSLYPTINFTKGNETPNPADLSRERFNFYKARK